MDPRMYAVLPAARSMEEQGVITDVGEARPRHLARLVTRHTPTSAQHNVPAYASLTIILMGVEPNTSDVYFVGYYKDGRIDRNAYLFVMRDGLPQKVATFAPSMHPSLVGLRFWRWGWDAHVLWFADDVYLWRIPFDGTRQAIRRYDLRSVVGTGQTCLVTLDRAGTRVFCVPNVGGSMYIAKPSTEAWFEGIVDVESKHRFDATNSYYQSAFDLFPDGRHLMLIQANGSVGIYRVPAPTQVEMTLRCRFSLSTYVLYFAAISHDVVLATVLTGQEHAVFKSVEYGAWGCIDQNTVRLSAGDLHLSHIGFDAVSGVFVFAGVKAGAAEGMHIMVARNGCNQDNLEPDYPWDWRPEQTADIRRLETSPLVATLLVWITTALRRPGQPNLVRINRDMLRLVLIAVHRALRTQGRVESFIARASVGANRTHDELLAAWQESKI